VVLVDFRVYSSQNLGSLWLASSPFVLGFPRTLGSSVSKRPGYFLQLPFRPLLSFDATSASCPSTQAALLPMSPADQDPSSMSSSLKLSAPSAFLRVKNPSSSLPLSKKRPATFAFLAGSPIPRVWLPSRWPSFLTPWKPLSAPDALGVNPSELFSNPVIGGEFPHPLPLSRFPEKPPGLPSAPQRLSPTKLAVPLLAPKLLRPGGAFCSLGLSDLSGSPSAVPYEEIFPLHTPSLPYLL